MEQLATDKDRGTMAWQCWQIGGYHCGNVTRQASYEPGEDIPDKGAAWFLEFLDGCNIVGKAEGYAVWPKNFQAFHAIVDAFDVVPKDSRQPPLKSKNLHREWLASRIGT